MLSVTNKPFKLSVIVLNVVMLIVVMVNVVSPMQDKVYCLIFKKTSNLEPTLYNFLRT